MPDGKVERSKACVWVMVERERDGCLLQVDDCWLVGHVKYAPDEELVAFHVPQIPRLRQPCDFPYDHNEGVWSPEATLTTRR